MIINDSNNNLNDLSQTWDRNGAIEFIEYNASYRLNTPDVLKNMNFNFGIVFEFN